MSSKQVSHLPHTQRHVSGIRKQFLIWCHIHKCLTCMLVRRRRIPPTAMQGTARKSSSEKATEVKESLVCAHTKLWSAGEAKDQSYRRSHSNHIKLNIRSSKKDDDILFIRWTALCIFYQPSTRMGFRWMITFAVIVWTCQSPGLWLMIDRCLWSCLCVKNLNHKLLKNRERITLEKPRELWSVVGCSCKEILKDVSCFKTR